MTHPIAVAACAVFLPLLVAQVPLVGRCDAARPSFGVATHAGVLHGLGPDYSTRFDATGVTFTPLLGERAAAPMPLHFVLRDVRRGDTVVCVREEHVAPIATGDQVRYEHAANVSETYDVRADGVEQCFVFATRPAGTGDLVVRGEITTALPLAAANDDGARFEQPGVGGVAFGAVTGIDANAATMRGSLRCDGRWIELSLPAAFVDSAAYPLVLDPLIGAAFLIANLPGGSDVLPSVAYDATTQRYLVVWHAGVSATVAEVRAQFVSTSGALGPQLLLDATAAAGVRPAIANINDRNRFVVAWGETLGHVALVAVDAANGAISPTAFWSPSGDVQGLALGGDSRSPLAGVADDGLLVATFGGVGGMSSAHRVTMNVPGVGAPMLVQTTTIAASQPRRYGPPAVSKHGGSAGRWMHTLAWRDNGAANTGGFLAEIVNSAGALCDSVTWTNLVGPNEPLRTGAATLDGSRFLMAYELGSTLRLRHAFSPTCGGTMALYTVFMPPTAGLNACPELDCAKDKFVLAWCNTPPSASVSDVYVMGVGLQANSHGAPAMVLGAVSTQIDPAVASRWSGGDATSDEALVTWASGGIRGRLWEATGAGTVASLGGACGSSGLNDYASYTGTPALGTTFTIELLAPTAPVLALIVGFTTNPLACGPCTIVPSPDVLLGGGGPVTVNVPLYPGLIGAQVNTQWLQWRPSGCTLLPEFGFSNTLRFTIAE
jgi:hypothetical protein